jgi:hypothetical protein
MLKRSVSKKGPGVVALPGLLKIKRVTNPATKARQGRNPATGEPMMIKAKPARTVVRAPAALSGRLSRTRSQVPCLLNPVQSSTDPSPSKRRWSQLPPCRQRVGNLRDGDLSRWRTRPVRNIIDRAVVVNPAVAARGSKPPPGGRSVRSPGAR